MKLWLFLIGIVGSGLVMAEPVINTKTQHYEFSAKSRKQIWQHIRRAGENVELNNGTRHGVPVAWTAYDLQLQYRLSAALYQCRLYSYKPILNVTVTLPHWKNKWEADPVLAENWDNYVRMVAQHESVHKKYAIQMAHELDKRLSEIGIMKSCREVKEKVEKIRSQVFAENKANNKWFDAKERVYQQKLRWF
ncbi:MAG: DUF922 domain-containing Zn-dependent protease [Pseudomonadales bacterium]|nr:DUF922 domain-containing Zn-dependent protease [Pseudomonadales bacterium]